ncbi:MAG TPA: hypothetical protein VFR23_24460 [Jiangellaceae bacterium]|nr:hypothetical protein [Jiangellaceae bacterium]
MADYITLVGAEAVERAGVNIASAAEAMQGAASSIGYALEQDQIVRESHRYDEAARADVEALTALVSLDAACQYAEAKAEGSFQVDPRDTEASVALRRLLRERGVLPKEGD